MDWLDAFAEATPQSVPESIIRQPSHERVPTTADELGLPGEMNGEGSLVSVVLPTYEDDHFLPEALQSVGAQTHTNLELIVVDSSRVPWIRSLAEDREWIRYLTQEPLGLSRARNDAIETANGEFVALLDADDYWHPEKLTRQLAALEDDQVISYTALYNVSLNDEPPLIRCEGLTTPKPNRAAVDWIERRIIVYPSTIMFRRETIPDRPFEESVDAWEDGVFFVETFKSYAPVHVEQPLVVYRDHDDSITADSQRMHRSMREVTTLLRERYPELRQPLQRWRARGERAIAREHLERDEKRAARQYLVRSFQAYPLSYKTVTLMLATWLPGSSARTVTILDRIRDVIL